MRLGGLHHITMVTADARTNLEFYAERSGLRFVKKTVNFDSPLRETLGFEPLGGGALLVAGGRRRFDREYLRSSERGRPMTLAPARA